jgi:GNAT superfamily N-acetyltransferase
MHAEIKFRQAVLSDSTELLKLIQWAMQVYAAKSGITTPLEALTETISDLEQHITRDHVLVAEHKHTLIGTVRLVRKSPGQAYFTRFAVHPHLQQTGVGRLLYQAAEAWLLQNGFRSVELHTALTNEPLVQFYQSRGFRLIETDASRGYPRGLFRKEL